MTDTSNATNSDSATVQERPFAEVVLSEEDLRVGTVRVPIEHVRLVRHVVTETRQLEIEVRREELRVERTPVVDAEAVPGAAPPPEDLVFVLSEEVPRVTMDVRPRERVRVSVHAVTTDRPVTADVRRERVAVDTAESGLGPAAAP